MPEPGPIADDAATGLTWAPLRPEHVSAWHGLLQAIVQADGEAEHLSAEDLHDELSPSWRDLDRDGWIVFDTSGRAVAFGSVDLRPGDRTQLRAICWGGVHPQARGRGIGRLVLDGQLRRARELVGVRRSQLGAESVPAVARFAVPQGASATPSLLRRVGASRVRVSCVLRRSLADPLPVARTMPGVTIRPYDDAWSESVRQAHNQAFEDHWGFQPWTTEAWAQWETGHRDFRADWSFVAHDRLGVAAYLLSAGYPAEWAADGFTQGWTSKLGVRPDRRRQGLGRALLVTAMNAYHQGGMDYAGLDVDAENTSNAVALYTGLGYELRLTVGQWALEL
jgi:mycothiol synthase